MNDAPPMLVFGQALGPPFGFPLWLIFLLIFLAHGGWVIGGIEGDESTAAEAMNPGLKTKDPVAKRDEVPGTGPFRRG